jgi:hypothetical protein
VRNIKYFSCSKFRTRRHTCPKLVVIYGHLQINSFSLGRDVNLLPPPPVRAFGPGEFTGSITACPQIPPDDNYRLAPGLALSYPEYLYSFPPRASTSSGETVSFGPGISRTYIASIYSQHKGLNFQFSHEQGVFPSLSETLNTMQIA